MTRLVLDTDVCIDVLRGRLPRLVSRLRDHAPDEIGISSVTLAELLYGVEKSRRPNRNRAAVLGFCAPLAILPFDSIAAEAYGRVRARLSARGASIGPMDTLIAAHCVSLSAPLMTRNRREFERVDGLEVVGVE